MHIEYWPAKSVSEIVKGTFVEEKLLTVSGYRDSVALENALSTPGTTRRDIDILMDRRLIRRDECTGMQQRIEITQNHFTQ